MVANIAPEMPAQIARWGGSLSDWQNNVQLMKNQITGRCSVITQGILDCYGVVDASNEKLISSFEVFPNPSSGQFTVTSYSKIKQVKLFDLYGREIEAKPMFINDRKLNLMIENKGVYLLQIFDNNNTVNTKKLVVE